MKLRNGPQRRWEYLAAALVGALLARSGNAAPLNSRSDFSDDDPFAILDLQDWVNPDNMTWDDVWALVLLFPVLKFFHYLSFKLLS